MDQDFMKTKSVLPLVLTMSYPMAISMAVNALYNIVDSFFVSQISDKAMTALSLLFPVQNFAHSVAVGFAIGINAVVAFYMGQGSSGEADKAAANGIVLSALHGIILTAGCIAIMPWFMDKFTDDQCIVSFGLSYTEILFMFAAIDCMAIAMEKIFQAAGRMKTTMLSLAAGCILNIILDPLLIFGIGPFPQLGIRGAAIATGIGQTLPLIIYVLLYMSKPLPVRFRKKYIRPELHMMRRLYSIGNAGTLNLALPSVQVSILNAILSSYSAGYVFILGVYYKLQTFLYLSVNGVVQGIRPLVGYNYGAGENGRVREIVRISIILAAIIMTAGTAVCQLIPGNLMGIFTQDEAVIQAGSSALRIISGGFIISSISVILSGALEGLGKGTESLVISLIRYIVFILPAAFGLSCIMGEVGVWHAFWITEMAAAAVSCFIYRRAVRNKAQREYTHTDNKMI